MKLSLLRNLMGAGIIALLFVFYQPVEAQTSVGCSTIDLVTAINTANSNGSGIDTLNLSSGCTYSFTSSNDTDVDLGNSALPRITSLIVMNGNGATITRGSGTFRLFRIESGGTLKLINMTVSNGNAGNFGGGLLNNSGTLTLVNATISGNTGSGGILNVGTLNVINSTISGNTTTQLGGGGIDTQAGTLVVINSLITGNAATGGLSYGGGIFSSGGSATVVNSVIAANRSGSSGGGFAGSGTITNSIIWGNSSQINGIPTITYSVVQGGYSGTANTSTDPLFVTLPLSSSAPTTAGNFQLQSTSPAINTGNNAAVLADWQDVDGDGNITEILPYERSTVYRILGTAVDKGAYETCTPYTATYTVATSNAYDFAGAIYCGTTSTINLASNSTYSFSTGDTLNNDSALPRITSTIIINGNGATIQRSGAATEFRLFYIGSGGNLTMNNITLTGGQRTLGGALFNNAGTVKLTSVTLSGNTSPSSNGGAIYNITGANLTINSSILSGNSATLGGGILNNASTVKITNSTISGNSASDSGGGLYNNSGTGSMTVVNSTISGNSASAYGAGIRNSNSATMTVTNSTISGNSSSGYGSAVMNDNNGVVTINNSTIAGNKSNNTSSVHHASSTGFTLTNSIVYGNSHAISGAITATYSIIEGGYTGTGNLDSDPLFVNQVDDTSAPTTTGDYHIQNTSPAIDMGSNAALSLDTTDIDGDSNTTETIPYDRDNQARVQYTTVDIGADEVDYCFSYVFPYMVASGDTAKFKKAINCANANATTDTINLTDSTYTFTSASGIDATYGDTALPHITSTLTINGNGATLQRDSSVGSFRLLRVNSGGNLTLNNVTISDGNTPAWGGGLLSRSGIVKVTNSTFTGNHANFGGGIYSENGSLTVTNSTFSGNSVSTNGGGIYKETGTLEVTNTLFSGNSADNNGGGLYHAGSSMTITNSTIAGNSSPSGGGLGTAGGTSTLTNSIIWGNSSSISGTATVTYSLIQGGYTGDGNLNADPLFVDYIDDTLAPTIDGDYHLQDSSPAINAGNSAALPADSADLDGDSNTTEAIPYDIDGDDRVMGTSVDMGADENDCGLYASLYTVPAGDTAALVKAMSCANASAETNTINLTANGTYTFTSANDIDTTYGASALKITGQVIINGNGATIQRDVNIDDNFRIFFVNGGNLTLNDVTVSGGEVVTSGTVYGDGAGIYNLNGTLTINNSILSGHYASDFGGAVYSIGGTVTVTNSTISNNTGNGRGGGVYTEDGVLTVTDSTITENNATYGGGIFNHNSTAEVISSTISANEASVWGGGVFANYNISTLTNTLISGNKAAMGGGISNATNIIVINSTIAGNLATSDGGGIMNSEGGAFTLTNSIVWGNSSSITGDTITATYSLIEGGYTGTGNFNTDPQFVNLISSAAAPTTDGDYHIQSSSPAADKGSNTALPVSLTTDFDGETRIRYGLVDLGVDEIDYCPSYTFPYTVAVSDSADFVKTVNCANVSADTNLINLTNSTYSFMAGDATNNDSALPRITSPVIINGNGAIIEHSNNTGDIFRLFYVSSGSLTLKNAILRGGSADNGGAIYNTTPGTLNLANVTLSGNDATANGGAVYNTSTANLVNTIVSGNRAAGSGGGLFNTNSGINIYSSTIAGNSGAGIYNTNEGTATVKNSIVWGNTEQIINNNAVVNVTYTTVEGGFAGTGNQSDDPLFVSYVDDANAPTTTGDYHLQMTSPVVNKGSNGDLPADSYDVDNDSETGETLPNDIDSQNRVMDGTVEMGADEIDLCSPYASPYMVAAGDTASLITAITCANVNVDTNVINLTVGTYTFTSNYNSSDNALPNISTSITINGSGATIERNATSDFRFLTITSGGNLTLKNVTLRGGKTSGFGGAILNGGNLTIVNSSIVGNQAGMNGGGIYSSTGATFINTIVSGNKAGNIGGGIYNGIGGGSVYNSTIAANSAATAGGLYNEGGALTVTNSIVYGNSSQIGGGNFATTNVTYSTVEGAYAGDGNQSDNPLFVNQQPAASAPTTTGDYHLQATSPAINAGSNASLPVDTYDVDNDSNTVETLPIDIDGQDRVQESLVDMGADEIDACSAYASPYTVPAADMVSLVAAINCANASNDTNIINLTANSTFSFITGDATNSDSALPRISTPITINGNGAIIERSASAVADFRLFYLAVGGTLELNNVTLQGGSIAENGGAIYAANSTILTIRSSIVKDNEGTGDTTRGGAIYINGTLTVIDSELTGNSAMQGGAIFMNDGAISVINTVISGNAASLDGAGIMRQGSSNPLLVVNSIFSGNRALDSGGGLYLTGGGNNTITNSTFAGNSAADGGGLYTNAPSVSINNSIIWGNSSQMGVGGALTVNYSLIEGGYTGTGNIDSDPLFVSYVNDTFAPTISGDYHLQTTSPAANIGNNGDLLADTYDLDGDLNTSEAIPNDIDSQTRILNSVVDMGADEVEICAGYASPYIVAAEDTAAFVNAIKCANLNSDSDVINLTASTYTFTSANAMDSSNGNSALPKITTPITINGNGAIIERSSTAPNFRLFYVSGTLSLDNVTVHGGQVNDGAGIYNTFSATLTITNSTISGNTSPDNATRGGGIYNFGTLTVRNSVISGNTAPQGGGIATSDGATTIINTTLSGNSAIYDGGGLFRLGSNPVSVTNSVITGNKGNDTNSRGGGIYITGGNTIHVINTTIAGNSAATGGGIQSNGNLEITNSILWGNNTQIQNGGTLTITSSLVEGGYTGTGNINADPLFVSYVDDMLAPTTSGDYRLLGNSPGINAGNTAALPVDIADLDGDSDTSETLPYDRDHTARIEESAVDMGAYEQTSFILTATFTPEPPTATPDVSTPTSTPDTPTPTFTPEPQGMELIIDGGFEIDIEVPLNQPDNWTLTGKSKDKRKCNTDTSIIAAEGTCAYLFKGTTTENAKLTQKLSTTLPVFAANDVLTMSLQYKTGASAPRLKVKVRVFYTNTGFGIGKMNKVINAVSHTGYTPLLLDAYPLSDGAVDRIKIQFHNRATSGKIYIDATSLILNQ